MSTIITKTASISYFEKNILLIKIIEDSEIDMEESKENFEATLKITEGKRFAALVDACVPVQVSPEARAFSAKKEMQENLIAQAIVVNTLANRLIGNFIINFNKPHSPTKLFSDRETALAWLREQVSIDLAFLSHSENVND